MWGKRVAYAVTVYMDQGEKFYFVTLTSHEKLKSREATEKVFPSAWGKLYDRMKRVHRRLIYVSIPEQHKDGRMHVHMLINHQFTKKWLKDNGRQCGLGYKADISEVENVSAVVAYVIKYLRKHIGKNNWSPHFRRVRTSRGFPELETVYSGEWEMINAPRINDYVKMLLKSGYAIDFKTDFELT